VPSPTALAVSKVIRSAMANAENNRFITPESLKVVAAYADDAPRLKRFRPQSRGRISPIIRRSCHITVIVDQEG
jgi:large subunit ribosomal protein L22